MIFSSAKNYRANKKALISMVVKNKTPYSPTGFIETQELFTNLKYGCKTSDYNGCGWIAMWNLFRALNISYGIAEMIRDMEPGLLLGGIAGTSLLFVKKMFKRFNLAVTKIQKNKLGTAKPKQGIIYIMYKNCKAHYICYTYFGQRADGKPLYRFHNNGGAWVTDPKTKAKYVDSPVDTLEGFIAETETEHLCVIIYDVRV